MMRRPDLIGERWTSFAFPEYSYVSGRFPHPLREADGHGCLGPAAPDRAAISDDWRDCQLYLWAIDLFQAGYYWESHEAWEGIWHAAGRQGELADLMKGLIKLAAAGVKAREGRAEGVRRHAARAEALFATVQDRLEQSELWGLQLTQAGELARQVAAGADDLIRAASADVQAAILPGLPVRSAPTA